MAIIETENRAVEKLSEKDVLLTLGEVIKSPHAKKPDKNRREKGRIRERIIKGRSYYVYTIGKKDIYLGSAEVVLKAVKEKRDE